MTKLFLGALALSSLLTTRCVAQCGFWDTRLAPAADGTEGEIYALTTWDPDGAGPATPQIIAAGDFGRIGGVIARSVGSWHDGAWHSLGQGLVGGQVLALRIADPDGPGPLGVEVVAGGGFTMAGGLQTRAIARWNGTAWNLFGAGLFGKGGLSSFAAALTTWDPDGPFNPEPTQLVIGGGFDRGSGIDLNSVALWNGSAFEALGAGFETNYVGAAATWDHDSIVVTASRLIVGGEIDVDGAADNISIYNNGAWEPIGAGLSDTVYALTTWDHDSDGRTPHRIVAGGTFTASASILLNRIAMWNGTTWEPFASGVNSAVNDLIVADPDGAGPLGPQLIAVGNFNTAGGPFLNRMARWDGANWQPFGLGFNGEAMAVTLWDEDGSGPLPPQLVVAGRFNTAGGQPAGRIAIWNTTCRANFNCDAGVNSQDFFDFLAAFFADSPSADFNADSVVNSQDFFDFLGVFFAGC